MARTERKTYGRAVPPEVGRAAGCAAGCTSVGATGTGRTNCGIAGAGTLGADDGTGVLVGGLPSGTGCGMEIVRVPVEGCTAVGRPW